MGRRQCYGSKVSAFSDAEVAKYKEINAAVLASGKSSDPQKNIARINSALAAAVKDSLVHGHKVDWANNLMHNDAARHELCAKEFIAADKDNSGSLDVQEVMALITQICTSMDLRVPPEAKVKELIKVCDKSNDGALQKNEFASVFRVVIQSCLHLAEKEEHDDYDIKDPDYVGIVLGGYGESTTTTGEVEVNTADVYVEEPRIVAGDDEEVDGDERSVWGDGDDEPNVEVEE
ncbi:unnamed protein product [Polarella glacialis]|uniref:EF-hand domain-containing protein n=1 Tax=Polarella glacialis TaxID=89957 RepID=A0A813LRK0_POLGL|nr:unnamed protein product [Polarella glacialis]CAE8630953.1 unnamed protein product [Polarella glacialis]CAE8733173.1 unnamed protein product [Polarella glacialis]